MSDVTLCIPQDMDGNELYTERWQIVSSDERLEGDFIPIFDRSAKTDMKIIMTDQHQVFGRFNGKAVQMCIRDSIRRGDERYQYGPERRAIRFGNWYAFGKRSDCQRRTGDTAYPR